MVDLKWTFLNNVIIIRHSFREHHYFHKHHLGISESPPALHLVDFVCQLSVIVLGSVMVLSHVMTLALVMVGVFFNLWC